MSIIFKTINGEILMKINLGYVGNTPTLLDIYSHNLTFKEFSKYDNDKGIDLLTERIKLNFLL